MTGFKGVACFSGFIFLNEQCAPLYAYALFLI